MKIKSQRGTPRRFSEALSETLSEEVSSQRLSVLLSLIVLPLNLSPNQNLPQLCKGQKNSETPSSVPGPSCILCVA